MLILKRIVIFLSIIAVIIISGHVIPTFLEIKPTKLLHEYTYRGRTAIEAKPETVSRDTTNYIAVIKKEMGVHKSKSYKNIHTWTVSNGIDLPVHTLELQHIMKRLNCTIDKAVESNHRSPVLQTEFTCPDSKLHKVTLKIGDIYAPNTAHLAIVFNINNSIPIEDMKLLDEMSIPYTLLVNPYTHEQTIFYDIKKLKSSFETVLEIPMEPLNYPYINPGKDAIYIHNTSNEIEEKLEKGYSKLPKSIGIGTINGTRAIEHSNLLKATLKYIAEKNHMFLDLTRSSRSKSSEVCSEYQISCPSLRYYTYADVERYLGKSINIAQKKGEHAIVLPLTTRNLKAVKKIISKSKENGITFVKLSSLS